MARVQHKLWSSHRAFEHCCAPVVHSSPPPPPQRLHLLVRAFPLFIFIIIFFNDRHTICWLTNHVWQFLENFPRKSRSENRSYASPFIDIIISAFRKRSIGTRPQGILRARSFPTRGECIAMRIDRLRQRFIDIIMFSKIGIRA